MKVLSTVPESCNGCRICEQWCNWYNSKTIGHKSQISVKRNYTTYSNVPKVCHQCEDAPCIVSCRFNALEKHPDTGAIIVNLEVCTGCCLCMKKCPHEAIAFDKIIRKVSICNLCGGKPQCVIHCPEGALNYLSREERSTTQEIGEGLWSAQGGFRCE